MKFVAIPETIDAISLQFAQYPAISYRQQVMSYAQLRNSSDRIAYALMQMPEYTPGKCVVVKVDKNLDMPAILLGILKARLAYIPLSSFHTVNKIEAIISDAGPILMVTDQRELGVLVNKQTGLRCSSSSSLLLQQIEESSVLPTVYPDDLAYVLYTSGSTGKPKGVCIEHQQLTYYIDWFAEENWGDSELCLPLTSALSFAAAVSQIYFSLTRGQTLHILPDGCLLRPDELLQWCTQQPHSALYCVPTIWQEILSFYKRQPTDRYQLPKIVMLSGEAVPESLKKLSFSIAADTQLFNLYGPTEATANASFSSLSLERPVRLGQPIKGSDIQILDENDQIINDGQVGEIYIIGPGVARGYLNDPKRTSERFKEIEGHWAHATGDMGYLDQTGELVYLGRKDRQLKLNGVRFEPGEIEQALNMHPGIEAALVELKMVSTSHSILVAYVVTKQPIPGYVLREYLIGLISELYIPTQFIELEAFPKLANGKIDRSRLPEPFVERPELSHPFRAAQSEQEKQMIELWKTVLAISGIGMDDDFFELGGNSLQVMRLQHLIATHMNVEVGYQFIFNAPTPCRLLSKLKETQVGVSGLDQQEQNSIKEIGLSEQQRYFLTLDLTQDDHSAYYLYFYHEIKGVLDKQALRLSIQKMLERHPVLRTRYDLDSDSWLAKPFSVNEIPYVELTAEQIGDVENARSMRELAKEMMGDIENTPLISFQLLNVSEYRYRLLICAHHSIFDRESIDLWSRQLIEVYQSELAGDHTEKSVMRYQDYTYWQQSYLNQGARDQEMEYWMAQLVNDKAHGAKAISVPSAAKNTSSYSFSFNPALIEQVKLFAKRYQTTPFIVLLVLFKQALNEIPEYQDVPIGVPVSNRMRWNNPELIGCFVNTIPIYIQKLSLDDWESSLVNIQEQFFIRMKNSLVAYSDVFDMARRKDLVLPYPVTFNYLSKLPSFSNINNISVSTYEIQPDISRTNLSITIEEYDSMLYCDIYYNDDLISYNSIQDFLNKFKEIELYIQ
ncbi:MAG: Linear gramicidin synthase subunit A [Candidatus Celerinatantimonas neptuna]|nr:MAG: Linear gramicidin synthase subunit A [Candidatus Celerinatantimonas neptuna]